MPRFAQIRSRIPIHTPMSLRDRFIQSSSQESPIGPPVGPKLPTLAAALMLAAASASGQIETQPDESSQRPEVRRPASAGRVVRAFDFEEKDYNPLPVPLGWIRAQNDPAVPRVRPGFPIWNGGIIDYKSPAYSGMGTANLPTTGGSTSLILRRGEVNIFPNADYLISARVRTAGLVHAKARVHAKLLDLQGNEIADANISTQLVNTRGDWVQVSAQIEGVYPTAAFIQVELQLLQPENQSDLPPEPFAVWQQDFSGNAYFDNLIIAQLPRLELSTYAPGNIVESDTPPPLRLLVRDLTGDDIMAVAKVYSVKGELIDGRTFDDGSKRVRTDWVPNLPAFGWYRAAIDVTVDQQTVGTQTLDFIWAPPQTSSPDSGMFSLHADLTEPKISSVADQLIAASAISNASVELWGVYTDLDDTKSESPSMRALQRVVQSGVETSVIFAKLPAELAASLAIDPDEVRSTFATPLVNWIDWGTDLFDNFGQAVSDWRFGDLPTQETADTLEKQHDSILQTFMGYVPGPVLVTPWAIDRPIETADILLDQQLQVFDHSATSEHAMSLVIDQWIQAVDQQAGDSSVSSSSSSSGSGSKASGIRPPSLAMTLSPLDESGRANYWTTTERSTSVALFARKAISFWWAASTSSIDQSRFDLELANAWRITPGKRGQVFPAPELAAFRTLAIHLGNRHAIAELDLIDGVRMLVAGPKIADPLDDSSVGSASSSRSDPGVMVLWIDDPSLESKTIRFPLALGTVTAYDLYNNAAPTALDHVTDVGIPVHTIEITRSPIIITGVNTNLVRFLDSATLTPEMIQSTSGMQEHELHLTNPWPMTIQGKLFIVEPGGYTDPDGDIDRSWEIRPRVISFTLRPDEHKAFPIEIAHSLGELAGKKKLSFDINIEADIEYPLIRIEKSTSLGLDGIEMELSVRQSDQGITLITARVTNQRSTIQDFDLVGIAPGEPRLRRSINGIEPGQQAIREFAFTKAKSSDQIVVSLVLRDSSARLNLAITVP